MDELETQPQATPAPDPEPQADGNSGAGEPETTPETPTPEPDAEVAPDSAESESATAPDVPITEPEAQIPRSEAEITPDSAEAQAESSDEVPTPETQAEAAPDSGEPEPEPSDEAGNEPAQTISIEEWIAASGSVKVEPAAAESLADAQLMAVLEACIYVAEEPLMPAQVAAALNEDPERIVRLVALLTEEYERPEHGIGIREVAGGYKMATKAEHHDSVRSFVKSLKAPLKLSLPALETLAVVAYKQPVTSPEIMDIRGVQGGGVLKTLLDRKLITESGRKNVIGKPILYKTTKEFLIQFGLKDLSELPTLKEFEEIRRMAFADDTPAEPDTPAAPPPAPESLEAETPAAAPEPAVETPEAAHASESEAPAAEAEPSEPTDAPAQNEDGSAKTDPTE